MPRKYTPEERLRAFWSKVDKSATDDGCWSRSGSRTTAGYAIFFYDGRQQGAHRFAYEITYGEIPPGMFVCHRCDNPGCVRPSHLFLGTAKENTHDMMKKGRAPSGERHGMHLHPERVPRGDAHYTRTNPELARHGEGMTHSKLTDDSVREIRRRYAEGGATQHALAAEFNVSVANVNRVVKRRLWQHVL